MNEKALALLQAAACVLIGLVSTAFLLFVAWIGVAVNSQPGSPSPAAPGGNSAGARWFFFALGAAASLWFLVCVATAVLTVHRSFVLGITEADRNRSDFLAAVEHGERVR